MTTPGCHVRLRSTGCNTCYLLLPCSCRLDVHTYPFQPFSPPPGPSLRESSNVNRADAYAERIQTTKVPIVQSADGHQQRPSRRSGSGPFRAAQAFSSSRPAPRTSGGGCGTAELSLRAPPPPALAPRAARLSEGAPLGWYGARGESAGGHGGCDRPRDGLHQPADSLITFSYVGHARSSTARHRHSCASQSNS